MKIKNSFMKFKVKITEEVIKATIMCGTDSSILPTKNCLLAYCYNQLVPHVEVEFRETIFRSREGEFLTKIEHDLLPVIYKFDCYKSYEERYKLFFGKEYELEIPILVIEYWYNDVAKGIQKLIDEENKILQPII